MRHGEGCSVEILPLALTPLRQAQGGSCSVRMTGLKGIARGDIFEEGREVCAVATDDARRRALRIPWQPSALFFIGRERRNSPI